MVNAKTLMVRDLIDTLLNSYDRDKLTFTLPQGLEHLKGKDANFEMVTSNTIQPILLNFRDKVVNHSISRIFVNTDLNGKPWKNTELKAHEVKELYEEILQFNDVNHCQFLPIKFSAHCHKSMTLVGFSVY